MVGYFHRIQKLLLLMYRYDCFSDWSKGESCKLEVLQTKWNSNYCNAKKHSGQSMTKCEPKAP